MEDPPQQEPIPETEPEAPEPEAPEPEAPAAKRRGRPPGSKNRPKITVVPVQEATPPPEVESPPEAEAESDAEPEPPKRQRAARPPRTRVAMVTPPPPPVDPHHTIMAYMANYVREQSRNEHQRKIDFYSNLINGRMA